MPSEQSDVTIRFLNIFHYLIESQMVSSSSDFAKRIGVSSSMMNEISKGRSNVGLSAIQNTVKTFPHISTTWILTGDGEMLNKNKNYSEMDGINNTLSEPGEQYNAERKIEELDYLISVQKRLIQSLEKEVQELNTKSRHTKVTYGEKQQ